ncbi:MAG: hypothetical protein ACE5EB_06745 [Thermodesulfobacteriota bacterium]
MKAPYLRTYLAVYLISTATLTYEIGLTRLFSLAQGYHFAFMVISIALMGIGAGGAVLMAGGRAGRLSGVNTFRLLSMLAAIFSAAVVISYITANQILFDPVRATWSRVEFLKILAQYLILSLPFVVSGMIISAAIRSMSEKVHRIYLWDMAGAGTGCVLILIVLTKTGGEGAVIVAASLCAVASLLFRIPSKGREVAVPVVAVAIIVWAALGPGRLLEVRVSPYRDLSRALNFPGGRIVETLFSPSGRLDIVESPAVRAAPGISLSHREPLPPQLGFTINGGGLTTVTSSEGDLSFLTHLPSSLVYRLKKDGDVFIVDPGGGMEVLSAMENKAARIWGAETNGVVLKAMRGRLSGFSGGLYSGVHISHGSGRNVLRTLGRRFDIIQLARIDTLGASSSGIRGVGENYSLTAEGFADYLDHLNDGGFISVSMYLLPPPRQELKLLSTAVRALEERGVEDPGARVLAIRSWGVMTLLVKKGIVDARDLEALKGFCGAEGFDLIWYPGMEEREANIRNRFQAPIYHNLFRKVLDAETRGEFLRDYLFDVSPSTDDRPFFGQTFKMTRMKDTYESVGRKWGVLIEGGYLLPWILLQAALASLVLIMAPLVFVRREKSSARTLFHLSAYFAAIGIGFMFVEIALIQKMIPVLGEPVYAISAVLFSILVSTGAGSYLSGRLKIIERCSVNTIAVVPLLILAYLSALGPISEMMARFAVSSRYLLTLIIFFPLGASMGVPFPTGMYLLGKKRADLIPWAWCVNGSFSVVSSVLVMLVALTWGFSTTLVIAALVYGAAWLTLIALKSGL